MSVQVESAAPWALVRWAKEPLQALSVVQYMPAQKAQVQIALAAAEEVAAMAPTWAAADMVAAMALPSAAADMAAAMALPSAAWLPERRVRNRWPVAGLRRLALAVLWLEAASAVRTGSATHPPSQREQDPTDHHLMKTKCPYCARETKGLYPQGSNDR